MGFFDHKDKDKDIDFISRRLRMVDEQLMRRDIKDTRVLAAMRTVPRHLFVPEAYRSTAYQDSPQPIGYGQTISQPYIVASMTEEVEIQPESIVLEIGTGCGYQTAVLAEIAAEVYTVEIIADLLQRAILILDKLEYKNIFTKLTDGSLGWNEKAPFDAIIVTAAAPKEPSSLIDQLKINGYMVYPLDRGKHEYQDLIKIHKTKKGIESQVLYQVRFVPMQGEIQDL